MTKRIMATFHPQAWQNDYAIAVDPEGEVEFDVTPEVVAMGKEEARKVKDDQYESDDLRTADAAPDWIKNWNGPFYVEVEQSIEDYFVAVGQ